MHSSGLPLRPLFCQITKVRQLEHLVVVRLHHQQQPQEEPCQADQPPKRKKQHAHEGNELEYGSNKSGCDAHSDARSPQQQMLETMEPHKAIIVERRKQEKNDGGKDRDIGNYPGDIFRNRQRPGRRIRALRLARDRILDSRKSRLRDLRVCWRNLQPAAGTILGLLHQRPAALRASFHRFSGYGLESPLKRISRRTRDGIETPASSESSPAALLVLLSASAWTRIISSDLVAAHNLLHRSRRTTSRQARLIQLATLPALELRLHVVHGRHRTRSPRRLPVPASTCRHRHAGPTRRSTIDPATAAVGTAVIRPLEDLHQV